MSTTEINRSLRALSQQHGKLVLRHPDARPHLAVGLLRPVQLRIDGRAGDFCAGLCDGPTVEIRGSTGSGVADNLMSGTVVVRQHAGRVAAIGMRGGTVMIYGNAGSRAGYAMKGGLLIVAGQAGAMAGHYMMGGRMILLGPAAEGLGDGMLGGEIYVAGNVSSLGRRTTRTEVAEREYREIMEALMLWGLDAGHHFRKVVPASAGPPGSVHPEGGRIE